MNEEHEIDCMVATADLTVVILTYNEELHLERAIASLGTLASRIIVVDSYSTDATCAIARAAGAQLLQNQFTTHARQFNWGLDAANITTDWVMRLDADEIMEPALVVELSRLLPFLGADVTGVEIDRKHVFMGRWIRHGGRFPVRLLRVWRNGRARVEDRWMDEHVILDGGRTVLAKGRFSDHNLQDLTFFTRKHNDYATREAIDVLIRKYSLAGWVAADTKVLPRHAAAKRWMKVYLYNRMPFELSALSYFLFRYIVQLGFLDGREGMIYHVLQGFWYRFLVGAKVVEFERAMRDADTPEGRASILSAVSGHRVIQLEAPHGMGLPV